MPEPSSQRPGAPALVLRWVRRRPIVTALAVLLIALRIALPFVLRAQIEKQANAAIAGRLHVGGVGLSLVRGSITLRHVALRAEEAAPTAAPVAAFRRLYVRLGYLGLLRHTLRIEDFALDGPKVALERLASGVVPVPALRPSSAPPAPEPAEKPSAGTPWNVVVDEAAIHHGRVRLRDHASDPPETAHLALPALVLRSFTLYAAPGNEPGHASIEAWFGDGAIRVENTITTRAEGYALETTVDVSNLPLDRAQLHAPQLRWSALTGRVDAHLVLRTEPRALPVVRGSVALRALRVDVPEVDAPALAWRKLAVEVGELNLVEQRALVTAVVLDGGSVLVTPKAEAPLPLLTGLLAKPSKAPAPAAAAEPAPPSKPWTWKVDSVEVTDTTATVTLEPPPIVLQVVKATVADLASAPGSEAHVDADLRVQDGTIGVTGTVVREPLGAHLQTRIAGLALGPLAAAAGAVPVRLPSGTLDCDLDIRGEQGTLAVAGKLGVADLGVRPPEAQKADDDFQLGWKRLDIAVRELRVPGALPGAGAAPTDPIRVALDELRLVAPAVLVTRDPTGMVLPASGAPPPAEPPPPPAEPAAAPRPVTLSLDRLALEQGSATIVDRAVKPFYRGTVSAIALQATELRYPERTFNTLTLSASLPGGAPLSIRGKQAKGSTEVTVDGKRLPLQQFNPYVTQAAGYSIAGGRLNVGTTVRYGASGYDSKTHVEFDQLGVGGKGGESLFLQKVGIPLTLVINLLRDMHGRIALDVPVQGDSSGTHVGLASIVGDALVKALIGALASPLKMFGAVVDLAGGSAAAAPEPIACRPGGVEPVDAARVEQVGNGLVGSPGLTVALGGIAGGADVRGLQERAVLADLQAKQGVLGGIRSLANRSERNAIRDALIARTEGRSGDLSPEYQKTLDEWAGEKPVSDDDLRKLAVARAERLRDALVRSRGIEPARIKTADPDVRRDGATPGVRVDLGS